MDHDLEGVRKKLVTLMRSDPPHRFVPGGREGVVLDRWMATRLSGEEVRLLQRLEELYGETALAELLAEALYEAGLFRLQGLN
jgi:hypothetical protein